MNPTKKHVIPYDIGETRNRISTAILVINRQPIVNEKSICNWRQITDSLHSFHIIHVAFLDLIFSIKIRIYSWCIFGNMHHISIDQSLWLILFYGIHGERRISAHTKNDWKGITYLVAFITTENGWNLFQIFNQWMAYKMYKRNSLLG